ncbi:MAG: flagellar hook basal-body protein [Planctomycetota bacterium]
MNNGLYSALSAMRASENAIEIVSHNLANLTTPGFKRSNPTMEEFAVVLDGAVQQKTGVRQEVDYSQGPLDIVDDHMKLAMDGPGFFVFDGPTGEVLSRYGGLLVSQDGELTSEEGLPVAWESRSKPIDPYGPTFEVRDDGVVMQDGDELGRLRLVDYADYKSLEQLSEGYFRAPLDLEEIPAAGMVVQGAIERPNVTGISELVEMVGYQRAYDIASRSVAMISESYQRLNRPSGS